MDKDKKHQKQADTLRDLLQKMKPGEALEIEGTDWGSNLRHAIPFENVYFTLEELNHIHQETGGKITITPRSDGKTVLYIDMHV